MSTFDEVIIQEVWMFLSTSLLPSDDKGKILPATPPVIMLYFRKSRDVPMTNPLPMFIGSIIAVMLTCIVPSGAVLSDPPAVRWGYWVPYDKNSTNSLSANATRLDYISPAFYTLDGLGNLVGEHNAAVSATVRNGNATIAPMVQNSAKQGQFSGVLNNPSFRGKAISNIVNAIAQYGYGGIHIDFEDIDPADRAGLTQFMADLYEKLSPRGILTTMALPAKEDGRTTGWAGAYDYAALGRYADIVVIMTYAYRTPNSTVPGSFAPISLVSRSAAYAASQISPNKILLGLGVYGFDWEIATSSRAVGRSMNTIGQLQRTYSGTYGYDETSQSAWMRYRVEGNDHAVWYESERSIAAKTAIARKYGLGGYAIWRLGLEGPESWVALMDDGGEPFVLDWDINNGHFFTQANGSPAGAQRTGFAISNDGGVRFWDEFRRLGGEQSLGYPASRRFQWNGFTVQVLQKGVMQWRPESNQVAFVNVLDELSLAGKDPWLWQVRSVPRKLPPDFDGQRQWEQVVRNRLALLDGYPAIKARYLESPIPMIQYGLPTSEAQDMGNHIAIRLQRAVLQQWKVNVPWAPTGMVTVANGGDLGKEADIFPKNSLIPEPPP
jgi:spore germination protein YaaH